MFSMLMISSAKFPHTEFTSVMKTVLQSANASVAKYKGVITLT